MSIFGTIYLGIEKSKLNFPEVHTTYVHIIKISIKEFDKFEVFDDLTQPNDIVTLLFIKAMVLQLHWLYSTKNWVNFRFLHPASARNVSRPSDA